MSRRSIRQLFAPLRGNILVLAVSLLPWNFTSQLIQPYEVLYIFALGGSGTILSLIAALGLIVGLLLRVLGGYIADIHGRSRIIGVITTIASFSYLFYIFADDWTWIVIGATLHAVTSLYSPAFSALRADSTAPNERGRGFVLLNILPKIPAIIAPAIGGVLIADHLEPYGINLTGVRFAYALLFLGMLSAGLIRLFFLKETLVFHREKTANKNSYRRILHNVSDTIQKADPRIKRLIILNGFFMFCFHFGVSFRSAYAINVQGLSSPLWGLIVSSAQIFTILTALFIGTFIDRYGGKRIFIPAIILLDIGTLFFILSNQFAILLFAMILLNIGAIARMMALQVLIANTIPKTIRGRILSTINIMGNIGSQLGIILSGIIYDLSSILPFMIAIILYSVAIVIARKLLEEPPIKQ
jgi:MFS family permease